ncbi:MAG: hypothetical protein AB1648_03715 [Pseudomonadota bacterium]|jgi:hypothetical protein
MALIEAEKEHLADLLVAIQRCAYFLYASDRKIPWPLTESYLDLHQKDEPLFESIAAINERFGKLQDTLGAAMRHAMTIAAEPADSFLRVLAFYEKAGVLGAVERWQECRALRNRAAHDYGIAYSLISEHFNTIHMLTPFLLSVAQAFLDYCRDQLEITPSEDNFADDFRQVTATII